MQQGRVNPEIVGVVPLSWREWYCWIELRSDVVLSDNMSLQECYAAFAGSGLVE